MGDLFFHGSISPIPLRRARASIANRFYSFRSRFSYRLPHSFQNTLNILRKRFDVFVYRFESFFPLHDQASVKQFNLLSNSIDNCNANNYARSE